jgi:dihydrofolate reductase
VNLIVAVDSNWGIGCRGNLLVSIPEDMRFFKEMTTGKTVIMGSATLKSLPGGKPLPNRRNIVLSRKKTDFGSSVEVCSGIDELFALIKKPDDNVFVIGGEEIYRLLLPYCKKAYITKIFKKFDADKYFPNIDLMPEWTLTEESETKNYNNISYRFCTYLNTKI